MGGSAGEADGAAAGRGGSGSAVRIPRAPFDFVVAVALLGLGLWLFLSAARIESIPGDPVGPDGFPRGLAAVFSVLCGALALGALSRMLRRGRDEVLVIRRPVGVAVGMALIAAFPAAMALVGYYPATAVLVPALMLAGGFRDPVTITLCTLGFLAFVFVVFETVLRTPIT